MRPSLIIIGLVVLRIAHCNSEIEPSMALSPSQRRLVTQQLGSSFIFLRGVRDEPTHTTIRCSAAKSTTTSRLRRFRSLQWRLPTVFAFQSWSVGCAASSSEAPRWCSEHREPFASSISGRMRKLGEGSRLSVLRSHSSRGQDIEDISDSSFAPAQAAQISKALVEWYVENKRDLPWRDKARWSQPAYAVWVSELMLQQTRVQTVLDYFERWMAKWPTVQALAEATEEEVNEMWSGLGYYRRARFLREGAKEVVEKHNGELPSTAAELKTLPGIGEYTAGAIASIAFGRQEPLVDGNVVRVLARLRALEGDPKAASAVKAHWMLARALVESHKLPAELNQALMELGATVCTPTTPGCAACPVASQCLAFTQQQADPAQLVTRFPAKTVKAAVRNQTVAVCVVTSKEEEEEPRMLLVRRPDTGLLASLWEFPTVPVPEGASGAQCRAAMAAYLTEAAEVMDAAGKADGEAARPRGGRERAQQRRGAGASVSVSGEGMKLEGETSFLFSHILQAMLVFSLQLPASHALASRPDVSAAAPAQQPDAGGEGRKKGKRGARKGVRDGGEGGEAVVVIEDDAGEESGAPRGARGKRGTQQQASPPTQLRWVAASALGGAALPRVARKAFEVFEQGQQGGATKKRKKAAAAAGKDEDGKQKTLSHFFSRINK